MWKYNLILARPRNVLKGTKLYWKAWPLQNSYLLFQNTMQKYKIEVDDPNIEASLKMWWQLERRKACG